MESSLAHRRSHRDPLIGRVLHDRYRVEKRIGKGGMGVVYLAEHVLLRRKVALKTLSERAFASEELIERFHREATAAAAIGNAHVVGVTDMGQLEDGTYFVVLEYLEGAELGHVVAEQGPFSAARAARVIMQLCDALSAVHARGIVHRDLKPENLFLVEHEGDRDFLKVLDFGVCKVRDAERPSGTPLTHTGMSLGTPQYMAPEQVEDSAAVDARTDIYAAGAILFFALTGRAAYDDTTLPRLLMRICSEPPPPLCDSRPDLPAALQAVIARAMARRPEDRYASSEALRSALEPFAALDAEPVVARVSGVVPSATLSPSMVAALRPQRPRLVLALAFAMVAFMVLALVLARTAHAPAPAAARKTVSAPPLVPPALELDPAMVKPAPAPVPQTAPERVARRAAEAKPHRHAFEPSHAAPDPPASAAAAELTASDEEPAPAAAAAPPARSSDSSPSSYRLSQRELKDVFP